MRIVSKFDDYLNGIWEILKKHRANNENQIDIYVKSTITAVSKVDWNRKKDFDSVLDDK